jgi:predicted S18 family serine protease
VDYLKIYIPGPLLEGVEADLAGAIKFSQDGSYELCLFSASKVKAEADAVLSSMGATKEGLLPVLDEMLVYVKRNIVEQTQKGHFPIVGYSYYEYAVSLKETNVVSAYVYAQYARELSNLDMYFPQGKVRRLVYFDVEVIQALVVGLLAGLLIGIGILRIMVKTHSGPRGTRSGKKR